MEKRYIVALEIASSHIAGIVAGVDGRRDASIVCYHEVPVVDCVRYGSIVNVDEVFNKVQFLLRRIQEDRHVAPRRITSVYVALSGRSLHTKEVEIDRELNEDVPISASLIEQIKREASAGVEKADVLDVVPKAYELDGAEVGNPVGSLGRHLHASLNVVVCRPQTRRNILMVFDRLKIRVNDFIIAPIASAKSLLTKEERQLGVALVDHGAETTTVAIYKKDRLMYLNVLPMGSRNITRDLVSLSLLEESAEKIKCNYGDAMPAESGLQKLDIAGVNSLDVANYVMARSGEIMENVFNQLELASLTSEQIPAGVVAIGRGMRLKHMPDLLKSIFKLPVRTGLIKGVEETMALANIPQLLAVVDEVASSSPETDDCLEMPQMPVIPEADEQPQPAVADEQPVDRQKKKGGFFNKIFGGVVEKISTGIDSTFDDDEDQNEKNK